MGNGEWTSTSMPYLTPRAAGDSDAWTAEAQARGRRGGQRIVHAGERPASAEVAEMLRMMVGEIVVVRRRIIELDDVPCELTDTYYPAPIAVGTRLASTSKIRGGAVTLLAELGHVGVTAVEKVTARMPSADECAQLRMGPGEPVLQISRVTLDADDRPIQADLMVMPAERQQLRYEIKIG
ncbi:MULTISPECIES: GntR family transcriptional regulator [unclassified Streptomyces]|uniref:GntR family transcriptional regulator n=1 Tax=unclassified Streptomyces TaxID=2593676 RepID=UPI001BE5618F|nr:MULTISPECIES: UTRA domain-containing protein [unclassified Streptomyces]MBT2405668.1 UTRA domain-containing protein [Streptomyces sp. ISL-21]MBT2459162.1 UTRA domain-containing protein [Streptomyces sp. ISL-86]MBT2610013.1 UTRA domain-containing protein [Streptomyces sp. ISL-87]